ncbi:MAG: DUF11 domain-containing protein [Solirubrobacteraceae bacterium]|nr:DUF11 domain-containing protein [Solirubrobacteraceae bacterium]
MSASFALRRRRLAPLQVAFATIVAFAVGANPTPASAAVSKKAATAKALAALEVDSRTTPEVVFVAPDPVAANTVIRQGGTPSASGNLGTAQTGTDLVTSVRPRTTLEVASRSWLFFDDLAPGRGFQRPGRVALVSTSSGKVTVSEELEWPPLVGDAVPVFLRSTRAYDASTHRVFERGARARRLNTNPLLISPELLENGLVSQIDASSCFVQMGDTISGDLYGADGYGSTTTVMTGFGQRMAKFRKSYGTARYSESSLNRPQLWLEDTIKGCKDVFLWVTGAGFTDGPVITLGGGVVGNRVKYQKFSVDDLAKAAKKRSSSRITLMLDVPNRSQWESIGEAKNVRLLPVPAGVVPGSRDRNDKLLTYTRRLLTGWVRQSATAPADRFGSSKLCEAGMPFFFSRALDPTACKAPAPPPAVVPTPAPAPAPVLLQPTTDLALGVSTSTPTPELGGIVTLNVSLTNLGPVATTNTFVKVPFPLGLTLLAPFPADYDPTTSLWNVGPVASGAVRILQLQATAAKVSPTTLTAEIFSSTPTDPDSNPNNGAPGEDDIASVTITPLAADLELTATPSAGAWSAGSGRDITITLTNKGPQPAIGNTVQVELPAGVDFDASTLTGGSYNSGNGLWTVPTLGVNESITLKLFVNVNTAGAKVIPISLIGAGRGDPDSTPANGPGEDDNATLAIPVT